jgi:hypothetical protein
VVDPDINKTLMLMLVNFNDFGSMFGIAAGYGENRRSDLQGHFHQASLSFHPNQYG